MTVGSVEPLKKLFARWGDRVHFLEVAIRQAHPGPDEPPYRSFEEKRKDAERYELDEGIPWPILVDDLEGSTHQVYGGLADPTYLIGTDGRVGYYNLWTYGPALYQAIEALLEQGGSGVVEGGVNRIPHMLHALTAGWGAIERGLPQSFIDLETASPGAATGLWLTHWLRPLLAPLTLRAKPLPPRTKVMLATGAAGLLTFAVVRILNTERRPPGFSTQNDTDETERHV